MKIIAGSRRGARLHTPGDRSIRPTPDVLRGSLFNILGQDMSEVRFLDLFAGTGAVGLEAVSRGAEACILVDSSSEAVALCRKNAARLGFESGVEIVQAGAASAVDELARRGERFDVTFAGPPYGPALNDIEDLAGKIATGLMKSGSILAIQLPAEKKGFDPGGLTLIRSRKFGRNRLLVFRKE